MACVYGGTMHAHTTKFSIKGMPHPGAHFWLTTLGDFACMPYLSHSGELMFQPALSFSLICVECRQGVGVSSEQGPPTF